MPQAYDKRLIQHYFNNDSPKNSRSDGGFITIAVQVNPILFDDPKSVGYITLWHIKNTTPRSGSGRDPALPPATGSPFALAGEMEMKFANEPLTTTTQPTANQRPPRATIRITSMMLQAAYQGLAIAPIFWKVVYETTQLNFYRKLNEWKSLKMAPTNTTPPKPGPTNYVLRPPRSFLVVEVTSQMLSNHWDKVGFNIFAWQQEMVWTINPQTKSDTIVVVTGNLTSQLRAEIAPLWTTASNRIQCEADYLAGLAMDGITRGLWYEIKPEA